ncbi:MAG: hypothetical protein BGO26_06900 [Actinobacteria bacterium 69-20]|nr:MFS transporter [Actinomycetota bacterium]OJV30103.1 MAG: hypothetical protein BGO26_06900 [Actinobacteria bacterium 69-20]
MGACEIASAPLMVLLGLFPQPVFGVALFALSSALGAAFNVQIMSVRQAIIPEHLFGRVQGAYRTVIWGGIPIGTLAGGALAGVVGLSTVIVLSGAASIVVAFVTYAVLRRHRAEIDAAFEIDAAVDIDTAVAGDGAET